MGIHWARSVLEKGSCWKVGNGVSVNIWPDKWLLAQVPSRPVTLHTSYGVENLVSDLIDDQTRQWRRELTYHVFVPYDAEIICSIPLSRFASIDKIVWHFSTNGLYTVKSGYRLIKSLYIGSENSA